MGDMGMAGAARVQAGVVRQPIDIEQLLVWTYRDQKADRVIRRGGGLHSLEAEMDGVEVYASSTCGCAAVARIQELGVRVDVEGRDTGALHPDAEVVHRMVMGLQAKFQGLPQWRLVIHHAAMSDRPDAMEREVPRPRAKLHRDGRPDMVWTDKGKRYGWCNIEYQPSPAMLRYAWEEYEAWHHALRLLPMLLASEDRLTRWRALPTAAPALPWIPLDVRR